MQLLPHFLTLPKTVYLPGQASSQEQDTLLHCATLVPSWKAQFEARQDKGLSADDVSAKFTCEESIDGRVCE